MNGPHACTKINNTVCQQTAQRVHTTELAAVLLQNATARPLTHTARFGDMRERSRRLVEEVGKG